MLVQERGIDFDPTDDYIQEVRLAGGEDELISALKSAKVTQPEHVDPVLQARQEEIRQRVVDGVKHYRNKQYAEAETDFRAALRLDPQNADLHLGLGTILHSRDNLDGTVAEYRESVRLNPNADTAHSMLGTVLQEKGDWDGDLAEQREALRLNPNNERAHVQLGTALAAKGNLDGAITETREASRLNPDDDFAHIGLGSSTSTFG